MGKLDRRPSWRKVANPLRSSSLYEVSQQCGQQQEDAYRCGAAAFRAAVPYVTDFRHGFTHAHDIVRALQPSLPAGNYTVIQIRAGGSSIDVDGRPVTALSWPDEYDSDLPNLWIRAFQSFVYSDCKRSVAVISDSARVLSEIRQAARDKIMVIHCCSQPLHRDRARSRPDEFYLQEVVDLFIMAGSKRIIAGNGNFATLGRYWAHVLIVSLASFIRLLTGMMCVVCTNLKSI